MAGRLSSPIDEIADHYTVVVVGSGYGGSIAASRLARAGRDVCLLERGREIRAGSYPRTATELVENAQIDVPGVDHIGRPSALYDFRVNNDIDVFQGCGLGGTSLVNANVSLRPDARVFADERWPRALRGDGTQLDTGFERAEFMLQPVTYPSSQPRLAKTEAHRRSAQGLSRKFRLAPINVQFSDGVNNAGVEQKACVLCGDCVTGCNHDAKNTLLYNYLPDAARHGAKIFCEVDVRRVEAVDDHYVVHYRLFDKGREKFEDAPTAFVRADVVILAAGALGSTEILLRSAANGLGSSKQIGKRFTGNGDTLGFAYNTDHHINGIGAGERSPSAQAPVGPTITSIIDDSENPDESRSSIIEEGAIPGALAKFLPWAFAFADPVFGRDTDSGVVDRMREVGRTLTSVLTAWFGGAYRGAVQNTQTYLVMAEDDDAGEMVLKNDRLRISWPDIGNSELFERINKDLDRATAALGGTYINNPLWSKYTRRNIITVHPLGGCVMADDAVAGVVNDRGQVFAAAAGNDVHRGLYVCDGAVVPRPLGVNPLLTISALAERCVELLAADRGWTIDYAPGGGEHHPQPDAGIGVEFTEVMRGWYSDQVTDDYEAAAERGEQDESPFKFTLTVISRDLDGFIDRPEHEARIVGTVTAPALAAEPLTVTDGVFNLFVESDDSAGRKMWYRMKLTSESGKTYYFVGFKTIHDDAGLDVWADCTTLYITVHEGDSEEGAVVGKGILRISVDDFVDQLQTMKITGASGALQRTKELLRFGRFFIGTLFDEYVKDKLT